MDLVQIDPTESKQYHTLQQTEDRVESGCISSCCSKDDHCGDDGCGVDHIGDDGGDIDQTGDGDFNDVN